MVVFVSGNFRCTDLFSLLLVLVESLLFQQRHLVSTSGEIPTGSHAEWNGDVRVKRQTRPRSRVGMQIVAKYLAVISRRRKSVFRRWRLMHESAIDSWHTVFSALLLSEEQTVELSCTSGSDWYLTYKRASWQFWHFTGRASKSTVYAIIIQRHLCSKFAL